MAEELDIFQDTTKEDLFADSVMAAEQSLYGQDSMVGRQDYTVGDDGNYYNEEGERVYYWVRPRETDSTMSDTGAETMGIGQDRGGYYTEAEIRSAWEAKEGMGYLKQQTDWDNYWGFISERQGLIQTGDLPDPTTSEYMADFPSADVGPAPTPNVGSSFGGGRDEEIYYAQQAAAGQDASNKAMQNWVQLNSSLMNKYGLPTEYRNSDGDTFIFNGSTFTRTDKVDDSFDVGGFIGGVVLAAVTAGAASFLAPALAGALGVSNSVANALITSALNLAQGEDIDIGTALSLVGAGMLPKGSTLGEIAEGSDVVQDAIDAIVGEITNPDNYEQGGDGEPVIVWGGHGGTDEVGNPIINIPDFTRDPEGGGGGGQPAADTTDADGDGVPASQDPDDNNPNVPNAGGTIVNDTGEPVTTDGDEVDGDGAVVGVEHNWKYLGDGCFIKIDENGAEIPSTKVCDPDYTTGDYGAYQVGGVYSAGDDPFGTAGGDKGKTVDPNSPAASYPDAGTDLGYECLPNGDKVVYTADGEGSSTTEIVKGGCLEDQNDGSAGSIILGGSEEGNGDGTGDSTGQPETTSTGSVDDLCSGDRPEEYGFGQINYDKYCGGADGDGTEGAGDTGAGDDGAGDDGTGEGDGGDGEGEGDGGDGEGSFGGGVVGGGGFEGDVRGLSYQAQAVPGLMSGAPVNAVAELDSFISRQLQKRGRMLT